MKFTALLAASIAVLAVSANARTVGTPRAFGPADLERFASVVPEHEANAEILPFPGPNHNDALVRRADAPKKAAVTLTKEQQTILDTHNKYRALHQAPPLKWNANSAKFGKDWIKQCQFKHSGGPHGENLAAGYKNFKAAVTGWYSEVKNYNYKQPGFGLNTGHFTQVVWKGTKTVGCAKKLCPNSYGSKWYIYICEYDGPGNIVGNNGASFKKNVLPLKKK
ncbi:CAP domain-containing protein [Gamsiella multidivaricata]|uniref:CAP domain-containing protein n=1 Tax=Gamsiella multidivaricata TaxID=101098 RepID=UPI00221F921A|nr:CAP domain-containing protein [Gamsiella multidivaricata]KAG0352901.1 hypothetical protein BGZ54_002521 [Gamsiella multidivaricata]KAI7832635.1 CAP domain-containing protein [Gamsiella multidivaricata]